MQIAFGRVRCKTSPAKWEKGDAVVGRPARLQTVPTGLGYPVLTVYCKRL